MVFLRHFTIPGDGGLGRAVWTLLHPRQSGAVARCNAGPCRYTVRCHGTRYIVKHIDHIAMEKHGTSSINTLQMEVFLSLNITENLRVSMEVSFFNWQKRTIMGRSSINGGSKRWEKTWKKSMWNHQMVITWRNAHSIPDLWTRVCNIYYTYIHILYNTITIIYSTSQRWNSITFHINKIMRPHLLTWRNAEIYFRSLKCWKHRPYSRSS